MAGSRTRVVVVLAAGEGKRLRSQVPKVLHRVAGRPLLGHVLAAVAPFEPDATIVVASPRLDDFRSALGEAAEGLRFVVQDPPRGTGDAARVALEDAPATGVALILAGDSPLVTTESLEALLAEADTAACVLGTARMLDPRGGGRVVRGEDGSVERIVEERDATPDELEIDEVNASLYAFDIAKLRRVLGSLNDDNAQGEYYLTDVVALLRQQGERVVAFELSEIEVMGVNSRTHLADVTAVMRERIAERWMQEGVTIVDPASTFIDVTVRLEADCTIHPFTYLEGSTTIGRGAEIGPQVRIVDSEIGAGASVSFAVVRSSVVGDDAEVGPFASLRPGTRMEPGSRLGTFVESKNTTIGRDSKANHLAYLGDARIGSGVNVGAGTITCNWDGREKHETRIGDDVYIGSDTMLVAPLEIGDRAATGAGSVVRDDVPDDALAVGIPARIIQGKGDRMGRRDKPEEDGGG